MKFLSVGQKNKLFQVVSQDRKITGVKQLQLHDLFSQSTTEKAIQIYRHPTQPSSTHPACHQAIGQKELIQEIIYFFSCDHRQQEYCCDGDDGLTYMEVEKQPTHHFYYLPLSPLKILSYLSCMIIVLCCV